MIKSKFSFALMSIISKSSMHFPELCPKYSKLLLLTSSTEHLNNFIAAYIFLILKKEGKTYLGNLFWGKTFYVGQMQRNNACHEKVDKRCQRQRWQEYYLRWWWSLSPPWWCMKKFRNNASVKDKAIWSLATPLFLNNPLCIWGMLYTQMQINGRKWKYKN